MCTMNESVPVEESMATTEESVPVEVCVATTEESVPAGVVVVSEPGRPMRTQQHRNCVRKTMSNIKKTLEWEACDEQSAEFVAVEEQFHAEFSEEQLNSEEEYQSEDSENDSMCSEDDDEYESSFVTDDSGSEVSEDCNWQPCKKKRHITGHEELAENETPGPDSAEDAGGSVEDAGFGSEEIAGEGSADVSLP